MKIGDVFYYGVYWAKRFVATLAGKLLIAFGIGFLVSLFIGR